MEGSYQGLDQSVDGNNCIFCRSRVEESILPIELSDRLDDLKALVYLTNQLKDEANNLLESNKVVKSIQQQERINNEKIEEDKISRKTEENTSKRIDSYCLLLAEESVDLRKEKELLLHLQNKRKNLEYDRNIKKNIDVSLIQNMEGFQETLRTLRWKEAASVFKMMPIEVEKPATLNKSNIKRKENNNNESKGNNHNNKSNNNNNHTNINNKNINIYHEIILRGSSTIMGFPLLNNGNYEAMPCEIVSTALSLLCYLVDSVSSILNIQLDHPIKTFEVFEWCVISPNSNPSLYLPLTPIIRKYQKNSNNLLTPFAANWRYKMPKEENNSSNNGSNINNNDNNVSNNNNRNSKSNGSNNSSDSNDNQNNKIEYNPIMKTNIISHSKNVRNDTHDITNTKNNNNNNNNNTKNNNNSNNKNSKETSNINDITNTSFSMALFLFQANITALCIRCGVNPTDLFPPEAILLNLNLLHLKCLEIIEINDRKINNKMHCSLNNNKMINNKMMNTINNNNIHSDFMTLFYTLQLTSQSPKKNNSNSNNNNYHNCTTSNTTTNATNNKPANSSNKNFNSITNPNNTTNTSNTKSTNITNNTTSRDPQFISIYHNTSSSILSIKKLISNSKLTNNFNINTNSNINTNFATNTINTTINSETTINTSVPTINPTISTISTIPTVYNNETQTDIEIMPELIRKYKNRKNLHKNFNNYDTEEDWNFITDSQR